MTEILDQNELLLSVLAIDPASRGLGYAILEGPDRLIDWGVKRCTDNSPSRSLDILEALIARYRPDVLVVEDSCCPGSRRCPRVDEILRQILRLARAHKIRTRRYSRSKIRAALGARSKHQIAQSIVEHFPELQPRLPAQRKPWESEAYAMAIFDAVALALTFFRLTARDQQQEGETVVASPR
jgi:Holliday junction resolvasome RuvABC endonuclease subunit